MDDLLAEFLTETAECMDTLDVELVRLEQNPNDPEILSNIFRLVHTVKGTCGFLGLPRLEAVAHASENVLGKVHGKFVLIFVAGSQHSIMGHRPVLAPLKRLGAGFGCARAAL